MAWSVRCLLFMCEGLSSDLQPPGKERSTLAHASVSPGRYRQEGPWGSLTGQASQLVSPGSVRDSD